MFVQNNFFFFKVLLIGKKEWLSRNTFLMFNSNKNSHKRVHVLNKSPLLFGMQYNADISLNNQFYRWLGTWGIINSRAVRHTLTANTTINHSPRWPQGVSAAPSHLVCGECWKLWPWTLLFGGLNTKYKHPLYKFCFYLVQFVVGFSLSWENTGYQRTPSLKSQSYL